MEFPVYSRNGLSIVSGSGYEVRDAHGKEFLDFYGGHAVAVIGHAHPKLVKAIDEQSGQIIFQTNAVDLPVRQQACEALVSIAPTGLDRVFLVNSGAEANENALRLAFQITGRKRVVCLKNGFHGRSAAASAVTDHAPWYAFPQLPFDVTRIPVNDVAALDQAVGDDVAAVILEPVQGLAGAVPLSDELLEAARKFCTERGALLIADEVQSGMGRTGKFFAVQEAGVVPDLMTVAKGIGGGFPAAALLGPASIADSVKPGWLGTTFGGGPLACAAIVATIEVIKEPGFLENVRRQSDRLRREGVTGPVCSVQGKGLLLGLRTTRPAKQVLGELLERGVLAGDAKDPHIVRLLPPLTIDDVAVDRFLAALKEIPA
jgi:acetylornithine/succinyldiaminopimelate/putrescine aminotransferase